MKGFELEAVRAAVDDVKPLVPELAPAVRERILYDRYGPTVVSSVYDDVDLEELVNSLTFVESLEVAYRLLGRLLDNVSSWRRLLRWAIGKVMGLIAGAIEEGGR